MALVLKCDCAAGDAYVDKTFGTAIAPTWRVEFDLFIPASTFTALASVTNTADFIQTITASANADGTFISSTQGTPSQFSSGVKEWWTDFTPDAPTGSFTPDTWLRSVIVEFNGFNLTWTYNGTTLFAYPSSMDDLTEIQVGAIFSHFISGEIYYIDNVKVYDNSNTLVFSDDFESGTFAAWSSTTGDVSIVADPSTTNITADFTGTPLSGGAPLTVNFTDASTVTGTADPITDWDWDFGDGSLHGTTQNSPHIYNTPGTYTVSLTVTGSDGSTDTKTRVAYITVGVAPTNTSCSTAIELAPAGGSLSIDNTFAPDTPLASDPANDLLGYNESYQFRRQTWYKLTNTSSGQRFALFKLHNASSTTAQYTFAALYLGTCADLQPPFNTCYNDQSQSGFSVVLTDTDLALGAHDWPQASDATVWESISRNGLDYDTYYLGIKLEPGQTVYLEMAGDDDEGGFNVGMTNIQLSWQLTGVKTYDTIDTRLPSNTTCPGLSEVLPSGTELDISGFDTADVGHGAGTVNTPIAYAHHGNYHFVASFASKEVNNPGGYGPGSADWHKDQLGVWQLDSTGAQVAFHVLDSFIGVGGVALTGNGGVGSRWDTNKAMLLSDGTNLWCIALGREPVANPYATAACYLVDPSYSGEWAVYHLIVYIWGGGSWSRVDSTVGRTTNQLNFTALGGGFGGYDVIWSACVKNGILHALWSEEGVCDAYDAEKLTGGVDCGISPRHWRSQLSYANFSTAVKIDEFDIIEEDHTASSGVIEIQNGYSKYLAIRPNDSNGAWVIWSPSRTDGTSGYQDTIEIYSVSGGSASLTSTITASAGIGSLPPTWSGANPDRVLQGWGISMNSAVDVGFDSKDVYFITIPFQRSTGPQYTGMFRLPINDFTDLRYFDDAPTSAATYAAPSMYLGGRGNGDQAHVYCEAGNTWIFAIAGIVLPGVVKSIAQWSRSCSFLEEWIEWPLSGGNSETTYPGMATNANYGNWLDTPNNFFYEGVKYFDSDNPYGYGANFTYGLGRSKILRKYRVCMIYTAPFAAQSIFWFFKDGTWHNAGNDPQYNLWFYRDGVWRSHLFDSEHVLYGQLDESWQN